MTPAFEIRTGTGSPEHRRNLLPVPSPEHRRSLSGGSAPLNFAEMRYVLTPEQSAKFDAVFEMHSDGGFMSGARVRDCLIKSELPKEELSTVWGLCKSEANLSPNLGRLEFRVAMHLVTLRLQGVPLPHVLPACLQSHRDGSHGPEAVASPGARSKSVVWPCHGSESIDWGAVMAPSPRGLSNSLLVSGVPRLASVDW